MGTPLIDTSSTAAIYGAFKTRITGFAPVAPLIGGTLASRNVHWYSGGWAPDTAPYPYVLARFMNGDSSTFMLRTPVDLELLLYARPRAQAEALENIADVIDQAMKQFTSRDLTGSGGLAFSRGRRRDTLPPFSSPADRELVAIRMVFSLVLYPQFLTVMGTSLPTA
jgi:hypothetical protein